MVERLNKMRIKIFVITFISSLFLFFNVSSAQEGSTVKEYLERVLPPQEGRKIALDPRTGILTITDTPSNHKLIEKLLKDWDVAPRQVMIQARFIEVEEGALDELGIEWEYARSDMGLYGETDRRKKAQTFYIGPAIPSYVSEETGYFLGPGTMGDIYGDPWGEDYNFGGYEHEYPAFSGTEFGAPAESAGLGLYIGRFTDQGSYLFSYIRALEQENRASLLSSPRVTTLSGQTANIELSNTMPYAEGVDRKGTNYGWIETYEIAEKKTGIFLEVTPKVGEGSTVITLDLHPYVSEVVKQIPLIESDQLPDYLGWPVVDTRSTQTSITIQSGETVIIGGLIKDEDEVTSRKVPLLGDIPLLGNLFKWKHRDRTKRNLVIFLTATIVTPEGREIR